MLNLTIVCGQHIAKPEGSKSVIDEAYVDIRLRGHPDDDGEEKTQATTKRVKNNGFNPVWNEAFNFDIKVPQLAFLELKIKEHTGKARSIMDLTKMSMKSKDKDLGIFCSPLQLIQEGYRRVPLKNKSGKDLAPATLLIHIAINKS